MSNPATFSERSRRPRIQTAEELAPYLSNTQPCGRSPYTHTADAPCHTSKNPGFGDSFWFGDALDPSGNPFGGLVVTCWGCLQKGSGPGSARAMLERVEDAFGVGIQVRWPGWDVDTGTTKAGYGELRYREPGFQAYGPPILRPGVFTSQLQKRDAGPSTIRWFATQGPETFTLADLQGARVWIAGTSLKAPWQESRRAARTAGRDTPVCFRQSLDDVDVTPGDTRTGLEVARDGGPAICRPKKGDPTPFPVRVRPWGTLGRIVGGIAAMSNPDGVHPCLVLSGGKEHACEVDVMAVDLDYHPDQDVDGVGRAFRDALAETLAKAGAPMFGSSSGNGWHSLLRQDADFLREAQENGTDIRFPKKTADPTKDDIGGSAFAELFHAGTKRLILLRWKKPLHNTAPDTVIPVVSRAWLRQALLDARSMAEGRPAEAPPEWAESADETTREAEAEAPARKAPRTPFTVAQTAPREASEPAQERQESDWDPFDDFQDIFPEASVRTAPTPPETKVAATKEETARETPETLVAAALPAGRDEWGRTQAQIEREERLATTPAGMRKLRAGPVKPWQAWRNQH